MEPTTDDIVAINQLMSLWGHILDAGQWDRVGEVLTEDAVYDARVFGIEPAHGIAAISANLSGGQHALAHHASNVVVTAGDGDSLNVLSKGLGLVEGGTAVSATYRDTVVPTSAGWRIATRVLVLQPPPSADDGHAGPTPENDSVTLERATFRIEEGHEAAFESAFREAREIVARAEGWRSVRLGRGVEDPSTYIVLLEWDSVAHHQRFRDSELFGPWAALLRPHYAAVPEAEHYELVR